MRKNNRITVARKPYQRVSLTSFFAGCDSLSDEGMLSPGTAKYSYNFDFSSGALREAYGVDALGNALDEIADAANVWEFNRFDGVNYENIIMYCAQSGEVYYFRDGVKTRLENAFFSAAPFAVNYRLYGKDVIIMCSPQDHMTVWDGESPAYVVSDSPLITSLAMHYERMFVTTSTEKNSVWFSDDLDPTNWNPSLSEGGFIEMLDERGKLNRVLSYQNYVYIFRDYGISRLTAFANQTDFTAANLFVSSGKIFSKTVALCGDIILFLAYDGLYSFDGISTRKALTKLSPMLIADESSRGTYSNGNYVLSVKMKMEDGEFEGLIVYDVRSGGYSIIKGVDIAEIIPVKEVQSGLVAVLKNGRVGEVKKCGKNFDKPLEKKWVSGFIDFNSPDRLKLFKELYIESDGDILVKVRTEKEAKDFKIKGGDKISKVLINLIGRKMELTISADREKIRIVRPTIKMSYID